jgi:putative transposase
MGSNNTKSVALHSAAFTSAQLFDDWFDPIEVGVRARVRSFIEGLIEAELETALSRPRYGRPAKTRDGADSVPAGLSGHRHGHRPGSLMGTFGRVEIRVPRARLTTADGKTSEWKSKTLPAPRASTARHSLVGTSYPRAAGCAYAIEMNMLQTASVHWVSYCSRSTPGLGDGNELAPT